MISLNTNNLSGHRKQLNNAVTKKNIVVDALEFMKLDTILTSQERSIRKHVREVGESILAPLVPPLLEAAAFDSQLIDACKQLGKGGLQIKDYGMTTTEAILFTMELTRIDGSIGTFYIVHCGLAMRSIAVAGTKEQKEKWLPPMARLDVIGAFGLTEPDYGSNATGLTTSAEKVPGGWILNGLKRWIGNATFSDIVIIWARVKATNEINGFIVSTSAKGLSISKIERKLSLRITQNADIIIHNCFVPDCNHLSEASNFNTGTQQVLESSRTLVAAGAVGLLLGAYDRAVGYAINRYQFNKPLVKYQLVQERLMRVLGILQAGVLTVIHLGRLTDAGQVTMGRIALGKAWCTKYGREGVALCRETLGGNGIIIDYGVIAPFIDMESMYTYEGTYDMNVLIAGREILGYNAITS